VTAVWHDTKKGNGYFGVFNVGKIEGEVGCPNVSDGRYVCELSQAEVVVKNQKLRVPTEVVIIAFEAKARVKFQPLKSLLFGDKE